MVATSGEPASTKIIGLRLSKAGNVGGGLETTASITADACMFEGCVQPTGAGAQVSGGSPIFLTCDFRNCKATGAPVAYGGGGGIRVLGASPTVRFCDFLDCSTNQNAAVLMNEGGTVAFMDSTIVGNPDVAADPNLGAPNFTTLSARLPLNDASSNRAGHLPSLAGLRTQSATL